MCFRLLCWITVVFLVVCIGVSVGVGCKDREMYVFQDKILWYLFIGRQRCVYTPMDKLINRMFLNS